MLKIIFGIKLNYYHLQKVFYYNFKNFYFCIEISFSFISPKDFVPFSIPFTISNNSKIIVLNQIFFTIIFITIF